MNILVNLPNLNLIKTLYYNKKNKLYKFKCLVISTLKAT